MDIKSKNIEILAGENYTFPQLADYLHVTEDGLSKELNDKTLELRNLEAMSKALRVSIYSFFRAGSFNFDYSQKPYYINKLWTGNDLEKKKSQLLQEIELFRNIILLKEGQKLEGE